MATCSPSELLASGSCFQCLTKKELQVVIAQLLCEIQSGGGGGGSSPKAYRAFLSQSGTDAPVPSVLENTLGVQVTWSRDGVGAYRATASSPIFTENKTTTPPFDHLGFVWLPIQKAGTTTGAAFTVYWDSVTSILLAVNAQNITYVELSDCTFGNPIYVEILVYP